MQHGFTRSAAYELSLSMPVTDHDYIRLCPCHYGSLESRKIVADLPFLFKIIYSVIHYPQLLESLNLYPRNPKSFSFKRLAYIAIYPCRLILNLRIPYVILRTRIVTRIVLVKISLVLASVVSAIQLKKFGKVYYDSFVVYVLALYICIKRQKHRKCGRFCSGKREIVRFSWRI